MPHDNDKQALRPQDKPERITRPQDGYPESWGFGEFGRDYRRTWWSRPGNPKFRTLRGRETA
jgi:hypothetical protein